MAKEVEKEWGLSEEYTIPNEHLIKICKYRQGESCCKYIVFFDRSNNFCCTKKVPDLKSKVDLQASQMKAQGDNCEGLPYETRAQHSGTSRTTTETQNNNDSSQETSGA
jgi:hypothetical protein